ncbi:hypothetical protein AB4262_08390 [Vibrio breoganii]|uniref:hypothetical protein n=1 Tax=Vibrio breoganii TaxID=553239 RepID=UPI000C8157A3|nr:hypothetical protein [Vibrio breoganii]PMG93019.1 hypothetical protein BCU80_00730 [Vibrio breoganii]PMP04057.1 hypothetical protein BCS95_06875 [Vibrio breoganii]
MSVKGIGLKWIPAAFSAVTHHLGKRVLELTRCRSSAIALVPNSKLSYWLLFALHLLHRAVPSGDRFWLADL